MTFDWRAYAREQGIPPMQAWIAVQRIFKDGVPGGRVTSPGSLDRLCEDESLEGVVRAAIEDCARGRL